MKKIISIFLSLLLFVTVSYGQAILKQNTVVYNNQEECKSDILLQQLIANDPSYAQTIANYKKIAKQGESLNKATLYTIPIVVHVVHLGEPEGTGTNISDAQIHSAINNLNQAYRNQAPYTGVDMEVEFCLASVDPSGNPTSGINRVNGSGTSDYATQGITNDGGSSMNEVTIKALSNWGNTNYYQFWIVAGIDGNMGGGGTQGYAYFSQASSKDGAVVLYNSFGYDPTGTLCYNLKSYTNQNVTTIHEVGHAFGLYHTFQGDGTGSDCPVNNDCNTDGDEVCDTPPHKRSASDCDAGGTNSCTGGSKNLYVHNFMDYSSDVCQTEFTANQKTKARAWLLAARASLTTSTKCNPVAVPISEFEAICGSQSGCEGSSINFFDLSEGNPTSWSWSFTGGTPSTSTLQYPTVSYAAAGTYAVTLTATNTFGTGNVETKNGFITIYSSPTAACANGIQNSGYFGYAISDVQFNTISNTTSPTTNGYVDNSCSFTTTVDGGQSYNLAIDVEALGSQTGFHAVYIDYNNNGILTDAGETVLSGSLVSGSNATTFNTNVVIPLSATTGTLLRMRVINDQASLSGPCDNLFTGESEDYGVYINPVGSAPVADFSGTPTTLCAGNSVSFSDLSTNTPTSWSWTFTGGTPSSSSAQNPTITYSTPGTYQVQLTATNASGSDGETKVAYITVNSAPSISSHPSNSSIDDGDNTSFSVVASNATGYQWQVNTGGGFGNISNGGVYSGATTSTLTITGAILTMDGNTYRCIVSGSCAPNATSNSALLSVVEIGSAPVADFSVNTTTICAGESVNFTDMSSNTPTSWSWDFGDGGMSSSQNTTYTYNTPGIYTVILTATNASGSDDEVKTNLITVNTLDDASFNYSQSSYCQDGSDPTPTISGTQGGTFTRSPVGLAINSSTGIIDLSASTTGTYTVTYTTSGFCSDVQNTQITIVNCGTTKLHNVSCGVILQNSYDVIYANPVSGVTGYIFEVSNSSLGYLQTKLAWKGGRAIRMDQFPGIQLNTTYEVRVKVIINGLEGQFGAVCQVTTAAAYSPDPLPTSRLMDAYCNITLNNISDVIYCKAVTGATNYIFNISNSSLSYNETRVAYNGGRAIRFDQLPSIQMGATYDVKVKVVIGSDTSLYGAICAITTPSLSMLANESARFIGNQEVIEEVKTTTLSIYPNPNTGEQLNISLDNLTQNSTLTITDIYGKVILTKQLNTNQSEYRVNVKFENKLSAGFYLVSISSDGKTITEKLIVR